MLRSIVGATAVQAFDLERLEDQVMATYAQLPEDTFLTKAQRRKMRVLFRAMQRQGGLGEGKKLRNRKRGRPASAKAIAKWKAKGIAKGIKGKGIAKGSKGIAKGKTAKGKTKYRDWDEAHVERWKGEVTQSQSRYH